MQGPEKNLYKEFDNEKKFLRLENSPPRHPPPPPPITFLLVRPLDKGFPAWIQTLTPRVEGISEIQAKRFP